ncbi:hypothetical protein JTB14_006583 [Gonioctena quinquepunctata]|nr:hypothetical protein JTB14_006583 [Gonioctena quinquepunctata]
MKWVFVGHSVLGREKCRQKFMNLQHTYTKYKDQIRQTGEGFIKKPPFFDELDDILGDKHKSNPVIIFDSSRPSTSRSKEGVVEPELIIDPTSNSEENEPKYENADPRQVNETTKKNKFGGIKKSVRPKKTILSTVENIIKEERTVRAQQFTGLLEALQEQSKQRHEQTMGIIELLKKQAKD